MNRYIFHLLGECFMVVMRNVVGLGNPLTLYDVVDQSYHMFAQRYLNGNGIIQDGLTRYQRRLLARRNNILLRLTRIFNANIHRTPIEYRGFIQEVCEVIFSTIILDRNQKIVLGQMIREISTIKRQQPIVCLNFDNAMASFDPVIVSQSIMNCLTFQFTREHFEFRQCFILHFDDIITERLLEIFETHAIETAQFFITNVSDHLTVLMNTCDDVVISGKMRELINYLIF